MSKLILASTSPYRRTLLDRLGVPFGCRPPVGDEEALKAELTGAGAGPRELAERLALAKSARRPDEGPDVTVIGCDQLVAFEGRTLGKPGDAGRAIALLEAMAGRSHQLITALAVRQGERIESHTDVTTLTLRPLTRAEIDRYVRADAPWDCAGGYKLEERGIVLFERIESRDHSAITGLPLIALTTILRSLGYAVP